MEELFDAISVGSGLGGLTAGASAALDGKRVLVLEQSGTVGGAATRFSRGGVQFDAGLHQLDGLDSRDPKGKLFDDLGVRAALSFVPTGEVYQVRHPLLGAAFTLPCGRKEAIDAAIRRFPRHEEGIRELIDTVCSIRDKVSVMSRHRGQLLYWLAVAPILPFRFRVIVRHERTRLGSFLDRLFGDDEAVKVAMAANVLYHDVDPDSVSLLYYSAGQGSYLVGGSHYIRGGGHALASHLANLVASRGGLVETGRRAREILLESGRAAGVVHVDAKSGGDPRTARARVVFGNAAPPALSAMLPEESRAAFDAPYAPLAASISLWQLYASLDRPAADFGVDAYSTFTYPEWHRGLRDTAEGMRLIGAPPSGRIPPYVLVDYSRLNAGDATSGNAIALCGPDALSNWSSLSPDDYRARKWAWIEALLADLDSRYPGIRGAVRHAELATAHTMHRYLGTPEGAVYGFAQTPETAGRFRPKSRTAVPGLYLASAFTQPGGGFTGAMMAGSSAFLRARRDGLLK